MRGRDSRFCSIRFDLYSFFCSEIPYTTLQHLNYEALLLKAPWLFSSYYFCQIVWKYIPNNFSHLAPFTHFTEDNLVRAPRWILTNFVTMVLMGSENMVLVEGLLSSSLNSAHTKGTHTLPASILVSALMPTKLAH